MAFLLPLLLLITPVYSDELPETNADLCAEVGLELFAAQREGYVTYTDQEIVDIVQRCVENWG